MNFLPRVPGLVSGRVGFSADRLVELSCCPMGMRDLVPLVSSCLPTSALGQNPHSHHLGLLASAIAAACASEVVDSV